VITDIDEGRVKFAAETVPGVKSLKVSISDLAEATDQRIAQAMEGVEAQIALEYTGVESSISAAIRAVKFGGTVFILGVGKDEIKIPFMKASVREVDLRFPGCSKDLYKLLCF
jgi:L-iditol 2-dehydrogenase